MATKPARLWPAVGVPMLLLAACANPNIRALTPPSGPERTLVQVDGDTFFSGVQWDAGTPAARGLAGGFLGASVFSVPAAAPLGPHGVQLLRSGRSGNVASFDVTAAVPFGAPRLDRISLAGSEFQAGDQVNVWLYVQGANVDVGAEVLVDGAVVPTVAHKGIRNDLLGIAPANLGFPIYHHLALLAAPGPLPTGRTLTIQIRNSDGLLSATRDYRLPTSLADLDSDGDDIPDVWERNGYDADGNGTIDVDLPALGANPYRPDVLVEVDVMTGLANPPTMAVWDAIRGAFEAAPIINPGPDDGIHLILDTSGSVPFSQDVSLTLADDATVGRANFYTLKAAHFDNAHRGRLYHYAIWANAQPTGWSGISDVHQNAAGTDFDGPGDDLIVSFDDFPAAYQTARSMAATFMHELGHNLQQRHGGVDHAAYNPTYNSTMSYAWQIRTGADDAWRRANPICAPLYYRLSGGAEVNGAVPAGATSILPSYSQGMGRSLVENTLDEASGVCGSPADWNRDGDTADTGVSRDLNASGTTTDTVVDYPNWSNLKFSGPRQNGQYGN